MSMYHNRPGHVYSLGEPFVVPLNRRRPACYDTHSYRQYRREMDGWKDGRLYPSVEEGTHAHIDKEGRYAHMKGSGRLSRD